MAAQRGTYSCAFTEQTIATASGDYDLWEITPADDKPVEIVAVFLSNKSEVGDVADEMLTITCIRGHTGAATGGAASTENPLDGNDGAASFAVTERNTAIATGGSPLTLISDSFNVRGGLQWILPEIMRPKATQGNTLLTVRLHSAAADDLTMNGTIWIREL